jgi:hypothetical protein
VVDGVLTANTGGGNTWKDLLKFNYRIGVNYFNSVVRIGLSPVTPCCSPASFYSVSVAKGGGCGKGEVGEIRPRI